MLSLCYVQEKNYMELNLFGSPRFATPAVISKTKK
jgi:hypothetical protein